MRRIVLILSAVLCVLIGVNSASALVLDFEDLTFTGLYQGWGDYLASTGNTDYHGFTIGGGGGGKFIYKPAWEIQYGSSSAGAVGTNGNYSLTQWGYYETTLTYRDDFYFTSAVITPGSSNTTVEVTGLLGGQVQYSQQYTVGSIAQYLAIDKDWADDLVDTVRFRAWTDVALSGVVIDDFTYQPVPVPGTAFLLIPGLLGLAGLRRLRQK